MKNFIDLLTALAILAIVNYLTMALGIVLLILGLMAALAHPRRALQLITALGLLALAFKEPATCAAAIGVVGAIGVVTTHLQRRRCTTAPVLLLPHLPSSDG